MEKFKHILKLTLSRKEILKNEKKEKLSKKVFNILLCNLGRFIYIGENIFSIYYIWFITNNSKFIFFAIFDIIILIDAIYVSVFRDGKEFSW